MIRSILGAVALVCALGVVAPVMAHHAMQAEFDHGSVLTGCRREKFRHRARHVPAVGHHLVDARSPLLSVAQISGTNAVGSHVQEINTAGSVGIQLSGTNSRLTGSTITGLASGSAERSLIVPREVGRKLQALTVMAGNLCSGVPKRSRDKGWM